MKNRQILIADVQGLGITDRREGQVQVVVAPAATLVWGSVGSGQGAVLVLRSVRFPDPPAEPGVHVSMHRALRVSCPGVNRLQRRLPVVVSTASESWFRDSGSGSL